MTRTVKVGETDALKTRVYFDVRQLDGLTPSLIEAGGQPQVSINGAAFSNTGISVLISTGFGKYYAELSTGVLTSVGDILQTVFKSGTSSISPGDTFEVIDNDFTLANPVATPNEYYGTLLKANQYFSTRLNIPSWNNASDIEKVNGLRMATQTIDRLNFSGDKANSNQLLQFPRSNTQIVPAQNASDDTQGFTIITTFDVVIPIDIEIATYLCAYRFLDGWDSDYEIDNLQAIENKYAGSSSKYDRTVVPEYIKAGIPSATAWSYLRAFLRDPMEITLSRVS